MVEYNRRRESGEGAEKSLVRWILKNESVECKTYDRRKEVF